EDRRTSSPPLRGEQRVPRSARRGWARPLRALARRSAGRADRAARGSPSLVHGEPVPSRAPLPTHGLSSALPGVHPRGAAAPARPPRGAAPGRAQGGEALVGLYLDRAHARAREGRGRGCRLMVLAHPRPASQPPTALRKSLAPPAPALPCPGGGEVKVEVH